MLENVDLIVKNILSSDSFRRSVQQMVRSEIEKENEWSDEDIEWFKSYIMRILKIDFPNVYRKINKTDDRNDNCGFFKKLYKKTKNFFIELWNFFGY